MSAGNDAVLNALGLDAFQQTDVFLTTTTQATAVPVIGSLVRVIKSPANGAMVMKSNVGLDLAILTFIVNDSANTVVIFSAIGESLGGSTNGSISIPSGQSAVLVKVPAQVQKGGGSPGALDIRAGLIP
jgi:hypothetical protein